MPEEQILNIAKKHSNLLILEENVLAGGFSSAILELLSDHKAIGKLKIKRMGLPDCFVEHGSTSLLLDELGLNETGILQELEKF